MSKGNSHEMVKRINDIAEDVYLLGGENPAVFLDSSAIIDFEDEIFKFFRKNDSKATPRQFYGLLRAKGFPVYVTEHIIQELLPHHVNYKVNGNPELNNETFEAVISMHCDHCDFLRRVTSNAFDVDEIRYHVYWAAAMAYDYNHKKKTRDPISRTDKELVADALWARYASTHEPGETMSELPISGSVILSSDGHVGKTAQRLLTNPFAYSRLRVLSSR